MDLKERLALLRREAGYSQDTFGEKLGVTQATIWHWENGRNNPTLEMAGKIAGFLCVSLDYLMGRTDERLYRVTWTGANGEPVTIWSKKENPTPQEREAIENIDVSKLSEVPVEEIDRIPGLSDYIRRIVREETSKTQDKG